MIEEVITRVVSLEDISADGALALINLLNLLKDNVPALFQVSFYFFFIFFYFMISKIIVIILGRLI